MRIAIVIGEYNATGGGAERWTDRHVRQLLQRGHEVHVLARSFHGLPETVIRHAIIAPRSAAISSRLAFGEAVEKLTPAIAADVVHDMGEGWDCDLFMPHHGTRLGGFLQNSKLAPPWLRWTRPIAWKTLPRYREFAALERRQYRCLPGKRFIALSRMVADHMKAFHGVPEDAIRIIPNGVDAERFTPANSLRERQLMRRKLGMDDRIIFLIVAHNFRLKGVDELIHAAARLPATRSVGIVVVGDGPIERYKKTASRLLQSTSSSKVAFRFVGSWPDPRPLYRAADVYVHPTYYDPCSLVALEALASGLPVVTTRFNGASELMTSGRHGFVLDDPGDIAALADSMASMFDDDLRAEMSQAARGLAMEWTIRRNTEAIESAYVEGRNRRMAA